MIRKRKYIGILLIGGLLMFGLFGCGAKRYHVDYDGMQEFYKGAKSSYRAGKEVTLYYDLIAMDVDYRFYLEGASLDMSYDDRKGYVIKFVMPDHDVKLYMEMKESMTYVPPMEEP